jgi:asparagine synthase (glutamine-hydrolysing)
MCGIVGAFDIKADQAELRKQILKMAKKIRHRGPDWSGIYCDDHVILAHERLAIVDPKSGSQPLISLDENIILAVNGEIYNHKELRKGLKTEFDFKTESDCEVILALYQENGVDFLNKLNGIFAFTLYDKRDHTYLISRDHMGIIPLYHGWDDQGQYFVASELKALEGICKKIESFPPGHYYSSKESEAKRWYQKEWESFENVKENTTSIDEIRDGLEGAVHRQLMSDVPYGVLLSGGLDSSIISAIVKKYADKRVESEDQTDAWWPQLHSFSVGLEGSPDLKYAQIVADHIGTVHHEIHFTIQEGLDAIRDVIYHLETYDVTTIRAATPMYLLARVIKSMGIKMVLSGEGADELFGGYLYFHKAPNAKAFHDETVSKLDKLHLYDCNRANKALAAWGVEGRVPFLDKEFIEVAMNVNPADKMIKDGRIEKWVLRKAFEDYLPESVVWRQKEQFSDGVGYSWIDSLKELVERSVPDELMVSKQFRFAVNPPQNKEEYFYRTIFEEHFPSETAALTVPSLASVACSTPAALEWDASFKNMNEPSGRAISNVHEQSYKSLNEELVK